MGLFQGLSGAETRSKEVVMTTNEMPNPLRTREQRERFQQIEAILRRLNPELTEEELEDLTRRIFQQSGFTVE